jgi:hypothetical protein
MLASVRAVAMDPPAHDHPVSLPANGGPSALL